ncbi:hypothetical protein HDV57DRAFT_404742 [Trichoderma longibrachiatum]|uniref:Uncharacterized protein n=1 Tax=Trichoderma longibrachiatum ATCC 18648 TaxID=983965 RepID=A0A2T4C231_TRILO|nr:hypothetical protein M440DRAFT_1257845 [Trichoderma longibrachiatum ATCC 18648]
MQATISACQGTHTASRDQTRTSRANKAPRTSPHRAGAAATENPWQIDETRRTQLEDWGRQEQMLQSVASLHELCHLWICGPVSYCSCHVSQRRCCGPGSSARLCAAWPAVFDSKATRRSLYLESRCFSRRMTDANSTSQQGPCAAGSPRRQWSLPASPEINVPRFLCRDVHIGRS